MFCERALFFAVDPLIFSLFAAAFAEIPKKLLTKTEWVCIIFSRALTGRSSVSRSLTEKGWLVKTPGADA